MGELKSCLFCGKNVDVNFEYCPYCGYEFGQGEDRLVPGSDLPGLIEESTGECVAEGDEDYLHRLHTLQEILTDMERELDLIIAMDGREAGPRTSSKGP